LSFETQPEPNCKPASESRLRLKMAPASKPKAVTSCEMINAGEALSDTIQVSGVATGFTEKITVHWDGYN
jgi:hypothetical protein